MSPIRDLNLKGEVLRSFGNIQLLTAHCEGQWGEKWTVPLGGGAGRAFVWEQLPVNVGFQAFYNIVRRDFGADWQTRFTVQFVL